MTEPLCLINVTTLTGNRFGVTASLAKNGFFAAPKWFRRTDTAYASVRGGRPLPRVFQLPQLTRARL